MSWETETQHAEPAAHSGATEHDPMSRGPIIIVVIAALVVAYFVMAGVASWTRDGMTGVYAGMWAGILTLGLLVGAWNAYSRHRLRRK